MSRAKLRVIRLRIVNYECLIEQKKREDQEKKQEAQPEFLAVCKVTHKKAKDC